jgi:large subunit ribosomal protein L18
MKRHFRLRKKVAGTTIRPRLCVFRSTKHIYAQVVDDSLGSTIVSACSLLKNLPEVKVEGDEVIPPKIMQARAVGKLIAMKLQEKGCENIVFDRGGYIYHGRVAALAEGVREGGIKF